MIGKKTVRTTFRQRQGDVGVNFPWSFSARSLSEIVWVVGGQAVTAIGTLVGVPLLTQFLTPTCYGLVSLALGVSTVAMVTACTPLIQAAMHFYPAMAATGSLSSLRDSIYRCLRHVGRLAVPISTIAAFGYFMSSHKSSLLGFVLMAMMVCEWFTSLNLAILNSARRQRRFALWVASLTWARPLVAIAAVGFIGESATVAGRSCCNLRRLRYRNLPMAQPIGRAILRATIPWARWSNAVDSSGIWNPIYSGRFRACVL
jgi:hypothetical protein